MYVSKRQVIKILSFFLQVKESTITKVSDFMIGIYGFYTRSLMLRLNLFPLVFLVPLLARE